MKKEYYSHFREKQNGGQAESSCLKEGARQQKEKGMPFELEVKKASRLSYEELLGALLGDMSSQTGKNV